MKKIVLLLGLFIGLFSVVKAQTWQELYDSTGDCWGSDWATCAALLEKALPLAKKKL